MKLLLQLRELNKLRLEKIVEYYNIIMINQTIKI